jgi:copper chaperone CopZ
MKRSTLMATALLGALCLTTSAWAGGNACSGKSEGASTAAGSHCSYKGAQTASKDHCAAGASMAGAKCTFGANTAVFSYAVNAHCEACVDKIQSAALSQKGVQCAKVDLDSKTAYIAGDKKMDQRAVTKAIKDAGFTCQLKQSGPKARAELTKLMTADTNAPAAPKKS